MEASSSGGPLRSRSSSSGMAKRRSNPGGGHGGSGSILSLEGDVLCLIFAQLDHFDLFHCSVVCKSWMCIYGGARMTRNAIFSQVAESNLGAVVHGDYNSTTHNIIYMSTLMKDLYYKNNPCVKGNGILDPLQIPINKFLEDLAMEQHRLAFLCGSAVVHQWKGHSSRISICRMKRGLFLTGGGDKVLRLWSSEGYRCLDEYCLPNTKPLVDFDFDENKVVGLIDTQLCIWRRSGQRSILQSRESTSTSGLCMCYVDPEAVIGCEDGRARIFDMYSGSCSRIIRMHAGPVQCMACTEDHLLLGGSAFGSVSISDFFSGEQLAYLKSSVSPTAMKSLCFSTNSYLLFAGSTSGYAHCWDLRTLRPVWETRVSPNVIYAVNHLRNDRSALAVGGLDGVLRILDQNSGELLSSFVADMGSKAHDKGGVIEKKATALPADVHIESIPRYARAPITSMAVGMKKIVTTHNEPYIRMWRFLE